MKSYAAVVVVKATPHDSRHLKASTLLNRAAQPVRGPGRARTRIAAHHETDLRAPSAAGPARRAAVQRCSAARRATWSLSSSCTHVKTTPAIDMLMRTSLPPPKMVRPWFRERSKSRLNFQANAGAWSAVIVR